MHTLITLVDMWILTFNPGFPNGIAVHGRPLVLGKRPLV